MIIFAQLCHLLNAKRLFAQLLPAKIALCCLNYFRGLRLRQISVLARLAQTFVIFHRFPSLEEKSIIVPMDTIDFRAYRYYARRKGGKKMNAQDMKGRFCSNARTLLEKEGMTAAELSQRSGVSVEILEELEKGRISESMMVDDALCLADAFGCRAYELFQ